MITQAAIKYLWSHGKQAGLTDRAISVIDSCESVGQINTAMKYATRCIANDKFVGWMLEAHVMAIVDAHRAIRISWLEHKRKQVIVTKNDTTT